MKVFNCFKGNIKFPKNILNSSKLSISKSYKSVLESIDSNSTVFREAYTHNTLIITSSKLDKLLLTLKVTINKEIATFQRITAASYRVSFYKIFSQLIYSFRNSLVHNRETEFHLNHLSLTKHPLILDTAKIFLDSFLILAVEEIVFYLLIEQNDIVWYKNSSIKLWDEKISFPILFNKFLIL